jgi:hypothetical protein
VATLASNGAPVYRIHLEGDLMRRFVAVAVPLVVLLALVPAAQAHDATASIVCSDGVPALRIDYTNFSPVNGQRETISGAWTDGTTYTFTPPDDQGTHLVLHAAVPNGTLLGANGHWAEGSFTVPAAPQNCQPPPPVVCTPPQVLENGVCVTPPQPPVVCTPPQVLQNGVCVTPPQPPVVCTPPQVLQNGSCVTPTPTPTPTSPTGTPTPPSTSPITTSTPPKPPRHHKPGCEKIAVSRVHASIGPQGLIKGNAVLRVSAPASVTRVRVVIHSNGRAYARVFHAHRFTARFDVTSKAIWGTNPICGCTYDTHVRIVVQFFGKCSQVERDLLYNNQDSPIDLRRPLAL